MTELLSTVAIVTGAARGIGKAIAVDFAREGAAVVVTDRTETEADIPGTIHATAELIRSFGGQALPVKCDVTSETEIEETVAKTLSEFGKIDILVNNAGVAYYRPVVETPTRHFDLVMGVNFRGAFLCTKAVLPSMMEKKSGSIINISSPASRGLWSGAVRPGQPKRPSGAIYGASKAALERLTRGLAIELKNYNIRVNALAPIGGVATEGVLYMNPDIDQDNLQSPHLYMTKAVVFLASEAAKGISGSVFLDEKLCMKYGLI